MFAKLLATVAIKGTTICKILIQWIRDVNKAQIIQHYIKPLIYLF